MSVYQQALEAEERGEYGAAAKLYEQADDERANAVRDVIELLADAFAEQIAPGLTCAEANAVVALYRAYDRPDRADQIAEAHAFGDDEPTDEHFMGTEVGECEQGHDPTVASPGLYSNV